MDLLKSMGIPVYTMSEMLAGAPAVDTNLTSSYTLPEPPRGDPRFGPGLYQLHDRILQGTQVGSPLSVLVLFVLPFFLLYAQTWLLVGDKKGTRPIRAAIAAAHSALWWKGISTWRFTDLRLNTFNIGLFMFTLHLWMKSVEFGLLKYPIIDPYMKFFNRPRWIAAWDLLFNSRFVSLGAVGVDYFAGPPNRTLNDLKGVQVERHFGRPKPGQPTTRRGAILFHLWKVAFMMVCIDTYGCLIIGIDAGGPPDLMATRPIDKPLGWHLIWQYATEMKFTFMPGRLDWEMPAILIYWLNITLAPVAIWVMFGIPYHLLAAFCLSTGLWEVQSWDVDFFYKPMNSTSVIDLWGKRWHQFLRHHLTSLAVLTANILHIPLNSFTMFPLSFFWSGMLHVVVVLSMYPAPSPWQVFGTFFFSSLGCIAEVAYKRTTGKTVGGWPGRIWVFIYMFIIGALATNAWMDAGMATGFKLRAKNGPGDWIAPFLLRNIIGWERRTPIEGAADAVQGGAEALKAATG